MPQVGDVFSTTGRFSSPSHSIPANLWLCLIALLAVKISMHPRTLDAFVLLSRFVCTCPIAFPIPPQSGEGECESGWRLGRGERLAEIVQGHVKLPSAAAQMISLDNADSDSIFSQLARKIRSSRTLKSPPSMLANTRRKCSTSVRG
jgi:hypothetical protein